MGEGRFIYFGQQGRELTAEEITRKRDATRTAETEKKTGRKKERRKKKLEI